MIFRRDARLDASSQMHVAFDFPLGGTAADEVGRRIFYISDDIVGFQLTEAGGRVTGVDLLVKQGTVTEDIARHVGEVLDGNVRGIRDFQPKRTWEADSGPVKHSTSDSLCEELCALDLIKAHGEGQVALHGSITELFGYFDDLFGVLSARVFCAEQYRFPTLLKTSALKRAGYFDRFPQYLMPVERMRNEIKNFRAFDRSQGTTLHAEHITGIHDFTCETGYCLPPTMCYYVYDMFRDTTFPKGRAVTAVGKSFRYENDYCHPLTRLWDFTIRETVFLGTPEYVSRNVRAYQDAVTAVVGSLGVQGYCEVATDPFFLTGNAAQLVNSQRLVGSKHELRLRIAENETVAAASFNIHGQYLSQRFNLRSAPGGTAEHIVTGCIGIGLERLVFAFLGQFGPDESGWPDQVKAHLQRRRREAAATEACLREVLAPG